MDARPEGFDDRGASPEGRRPVADVLAAAVRSSRGATVTLGELSEALGRRSYHLMLLLLALPNCVPAPPGLGSVIGLPLGIVAMQLLAGRPVPWLPPFIRNKEFAKDSAMAFVDRARGPLAAVEKLVRPRLAYMAGPAVDRMAAAMILVLALVILVPFPLTNMLPAMGAAVMAVSLLERDMAGLAVGVAIGGTGILLASAVFAGAMALVLSI